jgi:cytochrome c oxidase subunit 2
MNPRTALDLVLAGLLAAASLSIVSVAIADAADEDATLEPLLITCAQCHGQDFGGRQQRMAPRLAGLGAWYLERQLTNFRNGIRGAHPDDGYGMQMNFVTSMFGSDDEIRRFAELVNAAQPSPAAATVEGQIRVGRELYAPCAACHGHRGEGNEATNSPRLAGQSDWYLVAQLQNFKTGRRGTHSADPNGNAMAAATLSVTDDNMINDLVAYINTLD